MQNIISWIALVIVNLVSIQFLLGILLFVDTYVNDGFIPVSGLTDPIRFILARGSLLVLESLIWLVPMAYGNFLLLSAVIKVQAPWKFASLIFALEFGAVIVIVVLFMYGVFTRIPQ
jgi:hypothetical protein